MKRLFTLVGLVFSLMMQAQQMPQIPNDPEVRYGKLENGMTYYIRQNGYPEHRATFLIAQNVGAIQEKYSQRGLAHFLEHMCFNGSEHFKGNEIIEYLRSQGVEFGVNLNAETDIETTYYKIDRVPTAHVSTLDSCLLILKDWSNGLTLDDKEIDKERGVIHEEWRSSSNSYIRMMEKALPTLYPNNRYGNRLPIGSMDIIDNFKYDELKNYYKEWYHPENQALIVVGDIDVDRTEGKIKEMFSANKKSETASQVVPLMVEDNRQPLIALYRDKEPIYLPLYDIQATNLTMVMTKHPAFDKAQKGTLSYFISRYLVNAVCSMLNERFNDISQNEDCNFLKASAEDGDFLVSSTVDAFTLNIYPKDAAHTSAAVKEALMEVRRCAEQGFSEDEYNRFKESYMAYLESQVNNIESRDNFTFASEYMSNFFQGEPYPAISQKYGIMKRLASQIPFNGVNQIMEQIYSKDDSNVAVLNFNTEMEGATYPTEDEILKAINEVHNAELAVFEGTAVDGELIKLMPKAGTIKSEKKIKNGAIECTEITLSNGVKVYLKKTDFKKDEVGMIAVGKGGSSVYGPNDYNNLSVFDEVIDASGLGGLSNSDLKKALSGKKANVGLTMPRNGLGMMLAGSCRPKDMETMLQLSFLKFTNITRDDKSFGKWFKNAKSDLSSRSTQPMLVFQDSLQSALYGYNKRLAPMTEAMLDQISYDRILQIAKERMGSANGWEFVIVGNYDEETIRPLLCQYLGSLPANKANESELSAKLIDGQNQNFIKVDMETPMSLVCLVYINKVMEFNLENSLKCSILGDILYAKYLEKIREDAGIAYTAESVGASNRELDGSHFFLLQNVCPTAPNNVTTALTLMLDEITNLQENPVDQATLDKVKKQIIKKNEESLKNNSYWATIILENIHSGIDLCTGLQDKVNAITPEDIKNFVIEFLKANNSVSLIMNPK